MRLQKENILTQVNSGLHGQIFSRPPLYFAVFIYVYGSLEFELQRLEKNLTVPNEENVRVSIYHRLLDAFEADRYQCKNEDGHICILQVLWGK